MNDRIEIVRGDIARMEVDAIVNAANNRLALGAGVAGAIARADDGTVQRECDAHGPIRVGEAAITSGGRLPCRWILHAAAMGYDEQGRRVGATAETIRRSLEAAFDLARARGVRSIALPALGTGVAGFPLDRCADITLEVVLQRLHADSTLQRIVLVLFDEKAERVFRAELESRS